MPGLVLRSQVEHETNVAPSSGLQGLPLKERSLIQDSRPEDYLIAFPQVGRGKSRASEDSPAGDLNTRERRCGEAFHVLSVLSLILRLRTAHSHAHKSHDRGSGAGLEPRPLGRGSFPGAFLQEVLQALKKSK